MTILPIYNIIALPGAKLWLQTNLYRELSDKTPVVGERVTLLAPKEEKPRAQLTAESFQRSVPNVNSPNDFVFSHGTR